VDGIASESCSVLEFDISGVELDPATEELAN
jgi:hypothetical protein